MQFYVKDIMSEDLITINKDATIKELVDLFSKNGIMGVPVIDDDEFIIGVVSSSDVMKNESSHNFYQTPSIDVLESVNYETSSFMNSKVSTIMTKDLYSTSPDDTIAKMSKIMYDKKIHRLLVVDYNKLVGIVSTFDLLKLLATSDEEVII
ncbi:MAG: CBS domain-containing protein [Candidatus Gastranaerophilaceae bacterium]|jgi:predicted transcriptional regulator